MPNKISIKKIGIFFLLGLIFLCLVGCKDKIVYEKGIKPTTSFLVNDYYQDKMILQENATVILEGSAETGVSIVVELLDDNQKVVEHAFNVADKNGHWQVQISSPIGSYKNYSLKIYDAYKIFTKEIKNINFGKVIAILGEGFLNEKNSLVTKTSSRKQKLAIYDKDGIWYFSEDEKFLEKLTSFGYYLASNLFDEEMPIALILGNYMNAQLGAWVSSNLINQNSEFNRYFEQVYELLMESDEFSPQDIYSNHYLYDNFLIKLKNITVSNVIWYQGETDLASGIGFNSMSMIYAKILSFFIRELHQVMNIKKTLILQTPSISNDLISDLAYEYEVAFLREAQATAAYFNQQLVLATYSLGNDYQVTDIAKLCGKIISSDGEIVSPSYANLIITETKIIIEFSNSKELNKVDEINNLKILDSANNLLNKDLIIEVENNQIIITRAFKKIDETGKLIYVKYNISTIMYNYELDIASGNLINENNIAVVPFKILINIEEE